MDKLKIFLDKFQGNDRYEFSDMQKALLILEIGYEPMFPTEESRKILYAFPENSALIFALKESSSSYWPQLVLDWISSSKIDISTNLREALEISHSKNWATQNLKHQIRKYLKN